MNEKYWKIFSKLIPFIGIALFVYLIWFVGIVDIYYAFKKIKLEYFIFASLLIAPRFFLLGYKWYFICKKQKINVDFFYVLKITFISCIYAMSTPGAIGMHLRLLYMMKKSKESFGKCFSNSTIDLWVQILAAIFLALLGCFFIFDIFIGELSVIPAIIISYFIFFVLVFVIFIKKKTGSKLGNLFIRFIIPKRYKQKFGKTLDDVYEDIPLIHDLWFPFVLDIIQWIIASFQVYLIALSFDISIGFDKILWIHMITLAFTMILPVSIGNLGVREGIFITLLRRFGFADSAGMVISLVGYSVKTIIPAFIGVVLSFFNRDK